MGFDFGGMSPLLQVFDMPTSLRFYRDALGFEVISSSSAGDDADWVWLRRGTVDLMLNAAYEAAARPAVPEAARVEAHGDTAIYFSCRDLDSAYQHLKGLGVAVEPPTNAPYGMRQLYATDPDGYVLCFQSPTDDEAGERWKAGREVNG